MIFKNVEEETQERENKYHLKMGVSTKKFNNKPNSYEIRRIQYTKNELSIYELCEMIKLGYSFTHNFNTKGEEYGLNEKLLKNFDYTNYIWIDVDKAEFDIHYVCDNLTNKPTLAYSTMSNSNDSYRYRLLYLLDFKITSNNEYRSYLNIIVNCILNDLGNDFIKSIDKKCWNVSVQMYGSKKDCIIISDESKIYSNQLFDSIESKINIKNLVEECGINSISNKEERREIIRVNGNNTTQDLCKSVLDNYNNNFNYLPFLSNTDKANIDSSDVYIDVFDQNIYEINMYCPRGSKVPIGNRHNILFRQGIILRNISPNISIVDLTTTMWCLYKIHYTQSPDLGIYEVCQIGEGVMRLDATNERFTKTGRRKYLYNKDTYDNISREDKYKELGKAKRKRRDNIINQNYDWGKSATENSGILGTPLSTIYNFLNDNEFKTQSTNKYLNFVNKYKENPNIRSIRKLAKLTGVSEKTVQKYIRKIKLDEKDLSIS